MNDQNKNLILATVLSFVVILVWLTMFPPPKTATDDLGDYVSTLDTPVDSAGDPTAGDPTAGDPTAGDPTAGDTAAIAGTSPDTTASDADIAKAAIANAPRLAIDTPSLTGSISLLGGRIDDLSLKNYRVTVDPGSDIVQ